MVNIIRWSPPPSRGDTSPMNRFSVPGCLVTLALMTAAGAAPHVRLDLSSRDLSMVNESGDRVIAEGDYGISIGGGQPGTGAAGVQANFTIRGEQRLPE